MPNANAHSSSHIGPIRHGQPICPAVKIGAILVPNIARNTGFQLAYKYFRIINWLISERLHTVES